MHKTPPFEFPDLAQFFVFSGRVCHAEPFLAPTDPFLRHEIRLLQDHGVLSATTGTWPLSLGGISQRMEDRESWLGARFAGNDFGA